MARISNFVYCLNATASGMEANAMGILSAITPDYIPGAFSFSVFCSIVDLEDGNPNIKMQFYSPDNKILANLEGAIPYAKPEDVNLPKEHVGVNIACMLQNILLEKSGMYRMDVTVDGMFCGSYEIFVKGKNEAI